MGMVEVVVKMSMIDVGIGSDTGRDIGLGEGVSVGASSGVGFIWVWGLFGYCNS